MANELVVMPNLDLAAIWVFHKLLEGAKANEKEWNATTERVDTLLDMYAKEFPFLLDEIVRLKLEIRLMTKGTPVTEALDSISSQPLLRSDPNFNEQQYNAFSELLRKAYKKLAQMIHPDKEGGDADLFDEVKKAYESRNLTRLNNIFVTITKHRNLYWQQSEDGLAHASTEFDRPKVMMEALRNSPAFAIARFHMAGAPWRAASAMEEHLKQNIQALVNEINYMKEQNENRNQQQCEKDSTIDGCFQESSSTYIESSSQASCESNSLEGNC